jgi:colanic acid/amylovoran biosynthesis glycosyltransferase
MVPDLPAHPFRVLHIKQQNYLSPSETFVHARVLNPICQRPVPVITHQVAPEYRGCEEIRFYELNSLHPLRRRVELAIDYRIHWYPFYFQVIQKLRPQVIHAHFSGAGEACLWTAKWLRIPLIINFYGIETKYHVHDPRWIPRYKRMYAGANAFICSSDVMKNDMVSSGCPSEKIAVIRCGVDTDFFCGEPTPWESGQTLRLLSIARLHPEKGLNFLLEACQLLDASGFRNWQLNIIGIGPGESELKQQAIDHGIRDRVNFLGRRSWQEIVAELRQSHLMILPSLKETQGVVLQEAQATRTPVIASNTGGIPEGVLNGETGFLIEPGSPGAITEKVKIFAESPELLLKMGKAGRQFVQEQFSRQVEYQRLEDVYRRMIDPEAL